jgi:enamine deaminase RidA (YjgF/YER057c/UK114 family)
VKINPTSLRKPSGYTHGLRVQGGRLLFLAGQTAASLGEIDTDDFVEQFDRALAAVLEVVKEAGGKPADLVNFTIFVTDMKEYRTGLKPLGARYRKRMGRHYPCMALLEVKAMVDPRAKVEIQAIAVL